jgi:hypothetical protein
VQQALSLTGKQGKVAELACRHGQNGGIARLPNGSVRTEGVLVRSFEVGSRGSLESRELGEDIAERAFVAGALEESKRRPEKVTRFLESTQIDEDGAESTPEDRAEVLMSGGNEEIHRLSQKAFACTKAALQVLQLP